MRPIADRDNNGSGEDSNGARSQLYINQLPAPKMKIDNERRKSIPEIGSNLQRQTSKSARMAMPIVLMKDGSPQTPGANTNNLTPRSSNNGATIEALVKQL